MNGGILWANLHLLFWLSLVPFTTGWMGENHFARGADRALRRRSADGAHRLLHAAKLPSCGCRGADALLAEALGRDLKGKLSPVLYVMAIAAVWFVAPWIGLLLFVAVALMWLVPDRRMERVLRKHGPGSHNSDA